MSLPDTQAERDRRLRLDLKRRLKLAGFEANLAAISDVTVLRQLLVQQVPYVGRQVVEVLFKDVWQSATVNGYAHLAGEDFRRIDVTLNGLSFPVQPERVRPAEAPKPGGGDPSGERLPPAAQSGALPDRANAVDAFLAAVYVNVPTGWRRGQALFNGLAQARPVLAELVRGGPVDPFYIDARIPAAEKFIRDRWKETAWLERSASPVEPPPGSPEAAERTAETLTEPETIAQARSIREQSDLESSARVLSWYLKNAQVEVSALRQQREELADALELAHAFLQHLKSKEGKRAAATALNTLRKAGRLS